jgi:hypothetical protein
MTAEADQLQHQLLGAQNPDGGWAYHQGSSWTEVSALALLVLAAHRITGPAYDRARTWLLKTQRADGGWAPNPSIDTSTSVTSLAALALAHTNPDTPALAHGIEWILAQENGEIPLLEGVAFRLLGAVPPKAPGGSPWFPGTAPWIAPTVMSVLALARATRTGSPAASYYNQLNPAIRRAQRYILSRACKDGGWNHGGSSIRSEDAESYPEMTGMALLALQDCCSPPELRTPLARAEAFLSHAQSAEALSWLHLALIRHGRTLDVTNARVACRNNRDICLRLLALAASGNDVFTSSVVGDMS